MFNYLVYNSQPARWLQENRLLWQRLLIIAAVFFASAVLPRNTRIFLLPLIVIPGIGGTWLLLRYRSLGLVFLIVASLLVPFEIGTGTNSSLNATLLLLMTLVGLWLLNVITLKRRIRVLPSRPVWPLLGLLGVGLLSFGAGQLHWYPIEGAPIPAQIGGLFIFIFSATAFLLVANYVRDLRWLQWMTWIYLALGALYIVGWLLPGVRRTIHPLFQYGSTLSLFWTWLGALAFSQALFNERLRIVWRLALGVLTFAALYAAWILNGDWKSGWMPLLATIAVLLVLRFWRLGTLAILGSPFVISGMLASVIASDQYSYSTRIDAWLILLEIVKVSPILGLGPANYYWYTPLFPIRGYAVQFNSHHQFIDLLAQTGLLGVICFVWFLWEMGWLAWRLRTRVPTGFARAYVYGGLAGLAGTILSATLGDWVLPFVYNVGLRGFRSSVFGWLFLGGLVALEQMFDKESRFNKACPEPKDSQTLKHGVKTLG